MYVYKDSKELPLFNYERIIETGDFFYMVKGYDGDFLEEGEKTQEREDFLKEKFNEVVKDYVMSINSKSGEALQLGSIEKAKINLLKYSTLIEIINLIENSNEIRKKEGLKEDWQGVEDILKSIKIRRSKNLVEQKKYISERINMWKNNLEKAIQIQKDSTKKESKEQNINDIIVSVEVILERTIDLQKTSLYRFGKLQEIAIKKIETYNTKNK